MTIKHYKTTLKNDIVKREKTGGTNLKIDLKAAGQRIKDIRCQHNYSMARFSKLVGNSSASTVNNWEKGNNLPKQERLEKLAILGNTTVEWIRYGTFDDYVARLLNQNNLKSALDENQFQQLINVLKKQKITYLQDLEILTIANDLFPNSFETTYQISLSPKSTLVISEDSVTYGIEQDEQYRQRFLPKIDSLFYNSDQKEINKMILFQLFDLLKRSETSVHFSLLSKIFSIISEIVTNDIAYKIHESKIVDYSKDLDTHEHEKKLSNNAIQSKYIDAQQELTELLDTFFLANNGE
ncbi:hypothetical protein RV18_GL002834 [Enterococcus termitis]|nr:hypothetical protein RV18_GL002834 [Enterococcus termitis]